MTDIDALIAKKKHTPGPWHVSGGRNRPDIYGHMVGPDKFGIACVAYSDRTDADHIASLADARLIAAAPDMLAEIERLRTQLEAERARVVELEAFRNGYKDYIRKLQDSVEAERALSDRLAGCIRERDNFIQNDGDKQDEDWDALIEKSNGALTAHTEARKEGEQ